MENEGDWNATALFSPSKARVQQAQAKDWAVVEAWLSKRYSAKRLPAFERNEETLHALLTLANTNEDADDQRSYIDRIDKIALSASSKRTSANDKTYQLITSASASTTDIDTLAECVVILDCPTANLSSMATAICNLTSTAFALGQEVQRVKAQIDILKIEQSRLRQNLRDLGDDAFEVSPDTAEQTTEWLRDAKHMRAKLQEYDERLNATVPVDSGAAQLAAVLQQKEDLAADVAQLAQLNTQLQSFNGLPANQKAAQTKVNSARKELLALVKKRDQLFEQLADSG